ncbi:MAG: zinc metalloprotease [Actinomycetota bacterium]
MSFRLFGFPIRIDPSFLLIAIFGIGWGATIAIAFVVMVFITTLVHELGHAFAFRSYGRGAKVTLFAFGGYTQGDGGPLERGKRRVVSFAGPLASMVLLGVPALFIRRLNSLSDQQHFIANLFVFISIGWSLLNLLPILPLDGGQISSSILEEKYGLNGAIAARVLSIVFAAGGIVAAILTNYIFAAIFAFLFILQNAREIGQLRDANTATALAEGNKLIESGLSAQAVRLSQEIYSKAKTQPLKAAALELAAWAHLAAGQRSSVAEIFEKFPPDVRPSRALMATILLLDGQRDAGLELAVEAIRTAPLPNGVLPIALVRAGAVMDAGRVLVARGAPDAVERVAAQLDRLAHQPEAAELRALVTPV